MPSYRLEPDTGMWASEFIDLINHFRASNVVKFYGVCNRWGLRAREAMNLPTMLGTLFGVRYGEDPEDLMVLPAQGMPLKTQVETFEIEDSQDLQLGRYCAKGWQSALASLISDGWVRPDEELSRLLGEDSFKISGLQERGL